MPWTASDSFRIRKYLGAGLAYKATIEYAVNAITDAQTITEVQAMLMELDEIDKKLAAAASTDNIKELVGSIVFTEGGKTRSLLYRKTSLTLALLRLTGLDSYELGYGSGTLLRG